MLYLKYLFPLLGILLFTGCQEDFPVYSTFCNKNPISPPKCLHYVVLNKKDKILLQKHFNIKDNPQCTYRVELIKYHVKTCNNPVVKSMGSDFDGYVRIEIKKGFKCYYKVQSDYKSDIKSAFDRVLKRVKIDINQEKESN